MNFSRTSTKPLSIVLIGPAYPYRGGISLYNSVLFRELSQVHNVVLINFKRQYPGFLVPIKKQLDTSGKPFMVPSERLIDTLSPLSWFRVIRRIKELKPDLVIIHWWHVIMTVVDTIFTFFLRKKCPVTYLVHNARTHEKVPFEKFFRNLALSLSDALIVHSSADLFLLQQQFPRKVMKRHNHPVYDIYPPPAQSKEEMKAALSLSVDKKVILFFGLVRKYKGVDILLQALSLIPAESRPHLLVVGTFYQPLEIYQAIIDELKITDDVTLFPGYVPNEDVSLYFTVADLLVLPYLSASQSGVAKIAFSMALPIIASSVGGLPDIIIDGKTGLLTPPGDSQRLADSIKRGCDPAWARNCSENMKKEREKFSWSSLRSLIEELALELRDKKN